MRFQDWLDDNHPKFRSLTASVELTIRSLLKDAGIPFLTVSGRTKSPSDCLSKAKRKSYKDPALQMTDISGIRVVVYFDYDIEKVSDIIKSNFCVDVSNSRNKDELLSINEVGYRSVHFVCDLGADRARLQENKRLEGLKFEIQIRTVLQHAWAELAHDRNYKFNGKLPQHIERKLFLLAGLMETADNGFSDLSIEIDSYIEHVSKSASEGSLEIDLNVLSIEQFVRQWASKNNFKLEGDYRREGVSELMRELNAFGVNNLDELSKIIPKDFASKFPGPTTILGVVRDWMITSDLERFVSQVSVEWEITPEDIEVYERFLTPVQIELLQAHTGVDYGGILDDDDDDHDATE
ncbi:MULTISPECIES: hypothetical protein [unclassified Ensifer]|uniref:GTP pyrophosphokinase n=1 Tax=unclassified Ensifer TaxID=2633371 RepID=UPI0008138731|nr:MULTISPECIES: hypothetical protein [unclassified Ensifer]OCP20640.1 hypothetical protein BC363_29655 [Ensifer sp. LC384]OCP20678.1 hypothetical protein BC361_28805 [Ensifer sp. LC54]